MCGARTHAPGGTRRTRADYAAGRSAGRRHLIETTVERRVLHRGRFITFRVDTIEDADGRRHPREVVEHPGAVCVVPAPRRRRAHGAPVPDAHRPGPPGAPGRHAGPPARRLDRGPGAGRAPRAGRGDRLPRRPWRSLGSFWTRARLRRGAHAPVPGHGPRAHRGLRRARTRTSASRSSGCPGARPWPWPRRARSRTPSRSSGLLHLGRLAAAGELASADADPRGRASSSRASRAGRCARAAGCP